MICVKEKILYFVLSFIIKMLMNALLAVVSVPVIKYVQTNLELIGVAAIQEGTLKSQKRDILMAASRFGSSYYFS